MNVYETYEARTQHKPMVSIVVAHASTLYRECISVMLEQYFKVMGRAGDGISTIKLVERHKPDVVIINMVMLSLDGPEVVRHIKQYTPQVGILVIAEAEDDNHIAQVIVNGAHGYVSRNASISELIHAIYAIALGHSHFTIPISEDTMKKAESLANPSKLSFILTAREWETLRLVVQGMTSKQIATILHISVRTVEVHRANVMRKIQVDNTTKLIRYALEHGLITQINPVTDVAASEGGAMRRENRGRLRWPYKGRRHARRSRRDN